MPLQFTTIPRKDFSKGEDARSAPSSIPDGFAETLLNVNTSPAGQLETRKGYQGYYGWVPLRVSSVEQSVYDLSLRIGTSQYVDFSSIGNGPLLVYGRTSNASSGDFSPDADSLRYYPSFTLSNRVPLSVGTNSLVTLGTDHGSGTYHMFAGLATATDPVTSDWTWVVPDQVDVSTSTYDITSHYIETVAGTAFTWFLARPASSSVTHIEAVVAVTSKTISTALHQLENFNIIVRCYDTQFGTTATEVFPDAVTVDDAGEVIVTFGTAFTGDIILTCVSSLQTESAVAAVGTNTITISNLESPWVFASIYAYNNALTRYEQVLPDVITYSAATNDLTISYQVTTGADIVKVVYEYGNTIANRINLTALNGGTTSDTAPQLTVWGLEQADIYSRDAERGGHVHHLDTYRRSGEERAICGLGGTLFAARTRAEVGDSYGMDSYLPYIRGRLDGDVVLAPLFGAPNRTRGAVADASLDGYQARVTAATYVSAGVVDYTLSFTAKTGAIAIGGALETTDQLTISGMAWDGFNGSFNLLSVQSDSATQTVIRVSNAAAFGADFDELAADGRAGVFTDRLTLTTEPAWVTGDLIRSSSLLAATELAVLVVDDMDVVLSGVTVETTLPDGVQLFGERTTNVIPLRDSTGVTTTENLVRGDMLAFTDLTREVRVLGVNANADNMVVSITGTGTTATVTLTDEHALSGGQRFILAGTGPGNYDGIQVVTGTPSPTSVTFASAVTSSVATGRLLGRTVEIDEELTITDGSADATTIAVVGRWIPIELPTSSDDLPATTQSQLLTANVPTSQPRLRSATIADSMFFTNGDDEVYKFDGENVYRAGLFRWQPQLFVQVDTTTGSITLDATSVATSAWSANRFTVPLGLASVLTPGMRIMNSLNSAIYTVTSVTSDATNDYVYVAETITGSTGAYTLTIVSRYHCYFRLQAIDANQNVVASAVTGANDCIVELSAAGQIKHRLVGMPAFSGYDYDRIELTYFRTKRNTSGPYYLVQTLPVSFAAGAGYIDITDGTPDSELIDLDVVNTALLGAELGTGWDQPLRAKFVTTDGNRLLLSNVTGYPELDITLRRTSTSLTASALTGKRWLFRKDNTDILTNSDLTNRQAYEFKSSGDIAVSSFVNTKTFVAADVDTGMYAITIADHGLDSGARVRFTTSGVLPTGLTAGTDYYAIVLSANIFGVATTKARALAGTYLPITGTGSGTQTVTYYDRVIVTVGTAITGMAVNSWVYLFHAAAGTTQQLRFAGWHQATSVKSTTVFTVPAVFTGAIGSNNVARCVTASALADLPVWLGTDGNYNWQFGNPTVSYEAPAMLRLANAINASQRANAQLASSTFRPWLTAHAGSEYKVGQLVVRQPQVFTTTAELLCPTLTSTDLYQVFVNGVLRDSAEQVSAQELVFPSRTLVSYENYPEIFDSPTAAATASDSVVDVDAANGQETRMVIPFFGSSSFGTGQVEGKMIVLKTTSLYQLNVRTRAYQPIEQPYGGCAASDSVTQTKDGIMFANQSGVYRLTRAMTVEPVGDIEKRRWIGDVNLDALAEAQGHNYLNGNQYKLSVPVGDSTQAFNNYVFVFDYAGLAPRAAWTRHSNHNVTGWCNIGGRTSLFGTQDGQVYKIRQALDSTDYRDDAEAISVDIVLRPEDFDMPGVKKNVGGVRLNFHNNSAALTGISVSVASDMADTFLDCDPIDAPSSSRKETGAWFSVPKRKCDVIQVRIQCSTLDAPMILAGIAYYVAALAHQGTKEAAQV